MQRRHALLVAWIVFGVSALAYILWRLELNRIRENSSAGFLQPGSGRQAWLRAKAQLANITEAGWALKNGLLAVIAAPMAILLFVMGALPGDTQPKDRLVCAGIGVFFGVCSWLLGRDARRSWRKIRRGR